MLIVLWSPTSCTPWIIHLYLADFSSHPYEEPNIFLFSQNSEEPLTGEDDVDLEVNVLGWLKVVTNICCLVVLLIFLLCSIVECCKKAKQVFTISNYFTKKPFLP